MGIDLWSGLVGAMTGGCLFQIAFKNILYFVCIPTMLLLQDGSGKRWQGRRKYKMILKVSYNTV
jgi:hypothetical protein